MSHLFQDIPRLFANQHNKESSDPVDPKELQMFFSSLKQKAVLHSHRKLPILGLVLLYERLSISSSQFLANNENPLVSGECCEQLQVKMSGRIFRVEEAVLSWIRLSSLLMCQHIQQELFGN